MPSLIQRMRGWFGAGGTPGLEAGNRSMKRMGRVNPSSVSLNDLLSTSGDTVLARARYLDRNNAYAASGSDTYAGQIVGSGLVPSWSIENEDLRKKGRKLFNQWCKYADTERMADFWGIQQQVARELFVAGEVFVRFRSRRPKDRLPVPFQLQLLPAEMLPLDDNRVLPNGNKVRQGVEFDALGRRVAYHFYRSNPVDSTEQATFSDERTVVPAEDVCHVFERREFGQIRGLPRLSRTIVRLFQLDMYDEAELDRKRVAALFAGFITRTTPAVEDDEDPDLPVSVGERSADGASAIAPMVPGGLQVLADDEDIKFSEPADVGPNYDAFQYRVLTAVACAIGIPYAYLTGDMKGNSYSSMRAALIDFRKKVEAIQFNIIVFQFCQPVWDRFLDEAVLSGKLSIPDYAQNQEDYREVRWVPPRWEYMDPTKEASADKMAVDNLWVPPSEIIGSRGYDVEETYIAIARDKKLREKYGLEPTATEKQVVQQKPKERVA